MKNPANKNPANKNPANKKVLQIKYILQIDGENGVSVTASVRFLQVRTRLKRDIIFSLWICISTLMMHTCFNCQS